MITRRCISVLGAAALLARPRPSQAQPLAAPRRVGVLLNGSPAQSVVYLAALKEGLAEFGWVDGRSVELRLGYAHGELHRFAGLAKALVGQGVELMVCATSPATRAALDAAPGLPIVMVNVSNVVRQGFVASLAQPGGSVTGLTNDLEDVLGKLVEALREAVPTATRIGVLLGANAITSDAAWAEAQRACIALGLLPLRGAAADKSQLAAAVAQLVGQRAQAALVPLDGMLIAEREPLQALLAQARLPAAYQAREHVQAGGLLSYGPNTMAKYRYVAKYVDKILRGARPADLPIEQPTVFELVINLATAKALSINVPYGLLLRADEVIQ